MPETVQVALILNRLPKFAQIKLKEWHHEGRARPTRMASLVRFAKDIDDLYKELRKPKPLPEESLSYLPDVDSFERSRKRKRSASPEPYRSRRVSRSPGPSRRSRSRSFTRSPGRSKSPMVFRSQAHFKGTCAKCGKEGHSIALCKFATEDDKKEFFRKVKESKARKAKDKEPLVKFDKKSKKHDGPNRDPATQH